MQSQSNHQSLFCRYQQTDLKVYMERQMLWNSQDKSEEKQSWKMPYYPISRLNIKLQYLRQWGTGLRTDIYTDQCNRIVNSYTYD